MKIFEGLEGLRQLQSGGVLSIGNFDGMHRGHQRILEVARGLAGDGGPRLAVVTFEPHPMTLLRPEHAPPRLTPPEMKRALLEESGAEDLVVVSPTREVLDLTAERFWEILRDEVRPAHLVEGRSFSFGKGRGGTIERLQEWSAGTRVQTHVVEPVSVALLDLHVVPVSSSLIRWLLACGRARDAAICLARAYALQGEVIKGHQRGRGLGMPTANLKCDEQLIPADGVYAGRCEIDGQHYAAAVSIGSLPTFGDSARQVEAHLLDFDDDLYGRRIRVELTDWLREQMKFVSAEALKAYLQSDLGEVRLREALRPQEAIASSA